MRLGPNPFAGGPWFGLPPRRVISLFAAIWTLFAVVVGIGIHTVDSSQQNDFARIAAHPITTVGVVTLSDPGNHNSFLYRYHVGQVSYMGGSYPQARIQPLAASLQVGEALRVVYDSRDPAVSCACDPRVSADQNHWWQALLAGFFVTSIVAVVATLNAARRMGRRLSANA